MILLELLELKIFSHSGDSTRITTVKPETTSRRCYHYATRAMPLSPSGMVVASTSSIFMFNCSGTGSIPTMTKDLQLKKRNSNKIIVLTS